MKTSILKILLITAILATGIAITGTSSLLADEKGHSHDKKVAGPNGGLLITEVTPHLEFFLTKDRKVQITAVDEHNKPTAITKQDIKVTGGSRSNPTKMKFEKKDGVLISSNAFPEGKKLPVIVQIKVTPDAKNVTKKFYLDQNQCPECKLEEYACICEHTH